MKNFHCCATCIHFEVVKRLGSTRYRCRRLGFETRPHYRFDCWDPRPDIKKLIKKQEDTSSR
ncbi:hypothetical protein CR205_06620 [Alteribacter lacisalsi]|uniref:Uncharacterized protein n=1 Tax=Alteribacter lacisalsi TaxID=2045244 RepID=A0A2W0HL55_9BACI|nr:hypothetical protein CR205_06620 [Alteribacter lacisalsi]